MITLIRERDADVLELEGGLDGQVSESSTVSRHRVEFGSAVSDHTQPNPDSVVLRAIISQTPNPGRLTSPTRGPQRLREVLDWLRTVRMNGDVVLLSVDEAPLRAVRYLCASNPWNFRAEKAVEVVVTLEEYREVATGTADLPPRPRADVSAGNAPNRDDGVQPTENKSGLAALRDAAGAIFGGE